MSLLEGLGVDALGINCGLWTKTDERDRKRTAEICLHTGDRQSKCGTSAFGKRKDRLRRRSRGICRRHGRDRNHGSLVRRRLPGTTPAHIQAMVEKCKEITPVPITPKNYTFVTSYSTAVELGGRPVIIGERINPTGKSKFKQALRDHNIDYILEEGSNRKTPVQHILDVNVGLPEIDEAAMMETIVYELQSIMPIPLQIDTTNMEAMERALRIYNGKPMINSVNGKAEIMEQVFPLVKIWRSRSRTGVR